MKKAIRCFLSCILPCGSFDVIRIVHTNGRVEEISGSVKASEVMKAYPRHVLKKPTTCSSWIEEEDQEGAGTCSRNKENMPRVVILPPDAQLERGEIYFLMPLPPVPVSVPKSARMRPRRSRPQSQLSDDGKLEAVAEITNKKKLHQMINDDDQVVNESKQNHHHHHHQQNHQNSDDRYLSELLSEEKATTSMHREGRRGRVGVWRPHLGSIGEQ